MTIRLPYRPHEYGPLSAMTGEKFPRERMALNPETENCVLHCMEALQQRGEPITGPAILPALKEGVRASFERERGQRHALRPCTTLFYMTAEQMGEACNANGWDRDITEKHWHQQSAAMAALSTFKKPLLDTFEEWFNRVRSGAGNSEANLAARAFQSVCEHAAETSALAATLDITLDRPRAGAGSALDDTLFFRELNSRLNSAACRIAAAKSTARCVEILAGEVTDAMKVIYGIPTPPPTLPSIREMDHSPDANIDGQCALEALRPRSAEITERVRSLWVHSDAAHEAASRHEERPSSQREGKMNEANLALREAQTELAVSVTKAATAAKIFAARVGMSLEQMDDNRPAAEISARIPENSRGLELRGARFTDELCLAIESGHALDGAAPHFWSLYEVCPTGEHTCIADFSTEAIARETAEAIAADRGLSLENAGGMTL